MAATNRFRCKRLRRTKSARARVLIAALGVARARHAVRFARFANRVAIRFQRAADPRAWRAVRGDRFADASRLAIETVLFKAHRVTAQIVVTLGCDERRRTIAPSARFRAPIARLGQRPGAANALHAEIGDARPEANCGLVLPFFAFGDVVTRVPLGKRSRKCLPANGPRGVTSSRLFVHPSDARAKFPRVEGHCAFGNGMCVRKHGVEIRFAIHKRFRGRTGMRATGPRGSTKGRSELVDWTGYDDGGAAVDVIGR